MDSLLCSCRFLSNYGILYCAMAVCPARVYLSARFLKFLAGGTCQNVITFMDGLKHLSEVISCFHYGLMLLLIFVGKICVLTSQSVPCLVVITSAGVPLRSQESRTFLLIIHALHEKMSLRSKNFSPNKRIFSFAQWFI